MSHVTAELTQNLKQLHLPTVRQCYEEVARQAERESLSYERYLHELIQRECEERQENRIVKMLRESQLPLEKTLDAFDTKRLPAKAARQMRSLLDGGFLDRNENVLVFGNPGSGKTHMLQAISQELVRQGRRMLFTTCEMLVQDLLIAKRDLKLSRLIKRYSRYEGMVIDDLGYIRQTREEMEVVFTLLAERYGARQRPADQQPAVFQVGRHLQGPHDDGRGHRPAGPPQRHRRAQCPQLPTGTGTSQRADRRPAPP